MFGSYSHRIEKNGAFLAGYLDGVINKGASRAFLFTSLRIIRILHGSADWKIGNEMYNVRTGDIFAVGNTVPRQFTAVHNPPLRYEVFAFSPSLLISSPGALKTFLCGTRISASKASSEHVRINTIIDILRENISKSEPNKETVTGLILAAANMISDTEGEQKPQSASAAASSELVAMAIIMIGENISSPELSVEEISNKLNISRGYFSKIFLKYTGKSPVSFLAEARISRFLYLVSDKKMTVLRAIFESGFRSVSGFYKCFRNIMKTTPSEYIAKALNTN